MAQNNSQSHSHDVHVMHAGATDRQVRFSKIELFLLLHFSKIELFLLLRFSKIELFLLLRFSKIELFLLLQRCNSVSQPHADSQQICGSLNEP